ncbi:MAG: LysM peptidoglycan-binding domain-containing protein [Anaerolineae bacterium]|nr:LysM peptidoglycan-binding domain-containing protein [Anaerolineae bacterium]MCI0609865.1 LysM peptidoglycan-binding domain-containing protein [Anaerolineae bacterium]
MGQFIRLLVLGIVVILILYACNLFGGGQETATPPGIVGELTAVRLTKQAVNANEAFNRVGQVITYSYVVTNTGNTPLAGPATITDDKVTGITCPAVDTVGNLNNFLDLNESVTCTGTYSITQADLNAGSVTNNATATVGGVVSALASTTVRMAENKVLTIAKSASPTTYSQAGQVIKYTYTINNTGTTTLGPAQFIVNDNRISGPINCGAGNTTLATGQIVTCEANYTITQNDMTVAELTNSATASGGGAGSINPATITIKNSNPPGGAGNPNLTRGSTIKHQVEDGEWMLQIARCYGADFTALLNANPHVTDADLIFPFPKTPELTVPNIGSVGTIYGKPCVVFHTFQAGDTWESLAQKYNANLAVLREANEGKTLTNGVEFKIPKNSARSTVPITPPTDATRINIPAGTNTVTLQGTVTASGKVRYVLNALQGQTLSLKVTGPANELALAVYQPNGTALKAQDTTLTWTGTIPTNGDYIIELVSVLVVSNKSYTMEVTLTSPVAPAPITGAVRVTDLKGGNSDPAYLAVFNGTLYFSAVGNDKGIELWKYDGALNAPSLVDDIYADAGSSESSYLTVYNGALYFKANGNDGAGVELWRYNGSDSGRLPDINAAGADGNPTHLAVFNNVLYFSANGGDGKGVELWKTEGNTPSLVADIHSGSGDSNPSYLTVFNNALYFSATSNDGAGTELWKYDGTNPPSRVADINVGVGNSNPSFLEGYGGVLYFSANANDGNGTELWKYDGTNPPSLVKDINVGAGDSAPSFMTDFNGALYFGAVGNDSAGYELWKFDGTNATRVTDINPAGSSNPAYLAVYNNELYFRADSGDGTGTELWKFR